MSFHFNILGQESAHKRYVQVAAAQLIDRDTQSGEETWRNLIDHHCFRGNDTMMVFERFYGQQDTVAEIKARRAPDDPMTVELFFTIWLERNGYHYDEDDYLVHTATGEKFDGLLLDVTW